MAISFDHTTRLIELTNPTTSLAMQDLINAIRDEEASERGIVYPVIADAAGKDELGGGISTAITVKLKIPWKLAFWIGNYTFSIGGGNVVTANPDGDVTEYRAGNPQIEILRSAAGVTVAVGSGVTQQDKEDIANLVAADGYLTTGKFLALK